MIKDFTIGLLMGAIIAVVILLPLLWGLGAY